MEFPNLTKTEEKIFNIMTHGTIQSKEIAREMGCSGRTIEIHRYNIFKKFGVRNVVELVIRTHQLLVDDSISRINDIIVKGDWRNPNVQTQRIQMELEHLRHAIGSGKD